MKVILPFPNMATKGPPILPGPTFLKFEVIATKANLVTLQETHSTKKGKINIPNFVVFEAIQTKKGEGDCSAQRFRIKVIMKSSS